MNTDFKEVEYLKKEYLREVEKYRKLGYSFPEYKARDLKIKGHKILINNGVPVDKVVETWNNIKINEL